MQIKRKQAKESVKPIIQPANDVHPDKIFVRGQFTDFEKLLVANSFIEELKKKISALEVKLGEKQSELDEANYLVKEATKKANETDNAIKKMTDAEKKSMKKDLFVVALLSDLRAELNASREKNSKLKKVNANLINDLIKLNPKNQAA